MHSIVRAMFGAILVLGLMLSPGFFRDALSQERADDESIVLYFFWGDGCPHCAIQKPFVDNLKKKYPRLRVKSFETYYNKANARLYVELAKAFGITPTGVPATFLGDKIWIGFNRNIAEEIESRIQMCMTNGCDDPIARLHKPVDRKPTPQFETTVSPLKPVCIHVFVQGGCPQCAGITPFLERLTKKYNIELNINDVLEGTNRSLYEHFKKTYGFDYGGYPALFIGDRYLLGDTAIRKNLEREIEICRRKGCVCPATKIKGIPPYPPRPGDITLESGTRVSIPLLGDVDARAVSLPLMTAILGGLDSFNPCAFFVLFVLLGMLVHARSRPRMAIIGGTFVLISGLIYFLFMAAWLNLFMMVGHLTMVTTIAGVVALVVAGFNIKDYFFFGKGVSLVIPEHAKPKLFKRMRALLKASSLTSMLIGTIVLAIGANTYELLCTAGFPMVFTRILTLHDLSGLGYYAYLAFYNVVYVIPLLVIVSIFVATLGGKKLSEGHGQILKLLSGLMMLCLGIILLANPALLNNIFVATGMLAAVLVATFVIVEAGKFLRVRRKRMVMDDEE